MGMWKACASISLCDTFTDRALSSHTYVHRFASARGMSILPSLQLQVMK